MEDLSQYKDQFISEARDHLDTLNECLLLLEKSPEDSETINKTFRSFHTLKGNAATMGYIKFSEIAHDLEDVLSKIRDKTMKMNSDIMDVLLRGCDILEQGLDLISADKAETLDNSEIMEAIRLINPEEEKASEVPILETAIYTPEELKKIKDQKDKGLNVFRIIISFDKKNILKVAKAMILLRDLRTASEILRAFPREDEIKTGKFTDKIEILIGTNSEKEIISGIIKKIAGVVESQILMHDEKYIPAMENKAAEKKEVKDEKSDAILHSESKQVQSVKVGMDRLDHLMNLVGELLISKIRLEDIGKRHTLKELNLVLAGLDRVTMDLQNEVMQIRMIPIGNIFNRYPRMVRDLAKKENKQVELQIIGSEIEFDRTVLEEIGDPLVHMLRNSVDHGIETPEERLSAGKEELGIIQLIARREKNNAVIEVIDDGMGIDPKKVKESVLKKKIYTEEEVSKMTDNELQRLIFHPGASTNEVVTDVSGRGVGMNVVETKVKSLGGSVKLFSEVGKGTKITLELPLTVAIISSLMVKVLDDVYAIPLVNVDQTVDVKKEDIKTIKGNEVFVLRDREIPLLRLAKLFGNEERQRTKYTAVIVNKDDDKIGLIVDEIISQQQILIKGLDRILKGTKGVAGATILGNGKVALILDLASLIV